MEDLNIRLFKWKTKMKLLIDLILLMNLLAKFPESLIPDGEKTNSKYWEGNILELVNAEIIK